MCTTSISETDKRDQQLERTTQHRILSQTRFQKIPPPPPMISLHNPISTNTGSPSLGRRVTSLKEPLPSFIPIRNLETCDPENYAVPPVYVQNARSGRTGNGPPQFPYFKNPDGVPGKIQSTDIFAAHKHAPTKIPQIMRIEIELATPKRPPQKTPPPCWKSHGGQGTAW